ncbi:Uncharacterised protein [uncultured archaeon]|nr:Uncharacterised protein [uncultured archaeon]
MGGSSSDYSSSRDYSFSPAPSVTRKTARDYAVDDKREYVTPVRTGLPGVNGKDISTNSEYAGAILIDQTGSMKKIPEMFFTKISTFYAESNAAIQGKKLKELEKGNTLEDKLDLAIIAIGDSRNPRGPERFPFQVLDYCHGTDLVKGVAGIFPEGMGGGNVKESYDLGIYYLANHSKTPNVPKGTKVPLIILGDEGFYPKILASEVNNYMGLNLTSDLDTVTEMKKLKKKFDVFVLRPELSYDSDDYAKVQKQWEDVFGPERVLRMGDNFDRAVDCMIGIFGYAADNFKEAEEMLRRRQTPGQVDDVLRTLHPLLSSKPTKRKSSKKIDTD